jgi:hypothetical protein
MNTSAAVLLRKGITLENGLRSLGYHLAVLAVPVENTVYLAFVRNLVLKHHILILHVVEVSQTHPACHHRMHRADIQQI